MTGDPHSLRDPGTATATASSTATPPDLFAGFLGDTAVHLRGYVVFGHPAGTVDLAAVATADRVRDLPLFPDDDGRPPPLQRS